MADLIEKFYRSDLTEAEDEALATQLGSSEDAADQFAERAEQLYYLFGLPKPQKPGGLSRFLRSSWGRWMPVMVMLGGLAAWVWWPKIEGNAVPGVTSMPMVIPTPWVVEPPKKEVPISGRKTERQIESPLVPTESVEPPPTPRIPAGATPVLVGEAPPKPGFETDYRNLKVVVDQEKAGPITVRILSPQGFEVRRLYEGTLKAGKWSFSWDGIMADGMAAEPGVYHIQVLGAAKSISKEIIVR